MRVHRFKTANMDPADGDEVDGTITDKTTDIHDEDGDDDDDDDGDDDGDDVVVCVLLQLTVHCEAG